MRVVLNDSIRKCVVTKVCLLHSNGCEPSHEQMALTIARKGLTLTKIPTILLCTLQTLFVAKTKKCAIRDVLRDSGFIPEDKPITAQLLVNLEMRLE